LGVGKTREIREKFREFFPQWNRGGKKKAAVVRRFCSSQNSESRLGILSYPRGNPDMELERRKIETRETRESKTRVSDFPPLREKGGKQENFFLLFSKNSRIAT
jgi:hypothetical protein